MKEEVGYAVKQVSDEEHKELSPQWVYEIFEENYMNKMPYFTIDACHSSRMMVLWQRQKLTLAERRPSSMQTETVVWTP